MPTFRPDCLEQSATRQPTKTASDAHGAATNEQRFPGQFRDAETGLHYNYFRDYDPAIGRYWSWSSPRFVGQIFLKRRKCQHAKNETSLPTRVSRADRRLARSGRSVEDLAREFEPCAHTIYAWVDAGPMLVHRQAYAGSMPATLLDAMAFHVMVLPFIMFAYVVGGHNAERYSTWRRKRGLEKIKRNVGDGI